MNNDLQFSIGCGIIMISGAVALAIIAWAGNTWGAL